MASFDFNSLPTDPNARRTALFHFALARLDSIDDDTTQITAIAIAGSQYTKEDASRRHDGDAVSKGLFDSIGRFSGDTAPLHELRRALEMLQVEFSAS